MLNSAIYLGKTYHKRFMPKVHEFSYPIYFLWLDLDELEKVFSSIRYLSSSKYSIASFWIQDYLPEEMQAKNAQKNHKDELNSHEPELSSGQTYTQLKQRVIAQAQELGETASIDKVYFLGQIRTWGLYFSPVNFYYLYSNNRLVSILAQVSNTPWNERHFYLVPFQASPYFCDKDFQVSPFNDLDMQYRWHTTEPKQDLQLQIDNITKQKLFHAGINLHKQPLNNENFNRLLIKFPWMSVKTVIAIYWQALKLWLKGTPFYGYVEHKRAGETDGK